MNIIKGQRLKIIETNTGHYHHISVGNIDIDRTETNVYYSMDAYFITETEYFNSTLVFHILGHTGTSFISETIKNTLYK
jgi:hypothetical protein